MSVENCKALETCIGCLEQLCIANCMDLNIQKTKIIYFTLRPFTMSVMFSFCVLTV